MFVAAKEEFLKNGSSVYMYFVYLMYQNLEYLIFFQAVILNCYLKLFFKMVFVKHLTGQNRLEKSFLDVLSDSKTVLLSFCCIDNLF